MNTVALIIMVSIVVEGLIEYAKTIEKAVVAYGYKTAITQGLTLILGIGMAFVFHLELFNGAMSEFYGGISINPYVDIVLTGILLSRGSNYVSDLISKLQKPNAFDLLKDFDYLDEPEAEYDDVIEEEETEEKEKEE